MRLDPDEEEVLFDVNFLQKKRIISEKIFDSLTEFQRSVKQKLSALPTTHHISAVTKKDPKISRGENYGGLPYFILDYPREFDIQNTFAIRSMVYWGHFYSFTLQTSGENQIFFADKFLANSDEFASYYCCVGETPWEYLYTPDNYQKISTLKPEKIKELLFRKSFFKLSIYYPLTEYQNLHQNGLLFCNKIISLLD
ncbi:MAG: hypothetical protein AAFQ94_08395 [Bacteroidota bacterium]